MSQTEWYYEEDGKPVGPLSWGKLKSLAARGKISGNKKVWSESTVDWVLAKQVEGLNKVIKDGAVCDDVLQLSQEQQVPRPPVRVRETNRHSTATTKKRSNPSIVAFFVSTIGLLVALWSGIYWIQLLERIEVIGQSGAIDLNLAANFAIAMCFGLLLIAVGRILSLLHERLE